MFGKQRDIDDTDTLDSSAIDGFFGDEAAAEAVVEVHELQHRVQQVESQISSQFTSLATYAQIAQEQVELARSEAKAATERSERRLTTLVERERADRIASFTGRAPAGSAPEVTTRLDALEHSVAQIRKSLDECLQRQKALADAIATMFERMPWTTPAIGPDPVTPRVEEIDAEMFEAADVISFAPLTLDPPTLEAHRSSAPPLGGPIADLSLEG
jgi:ElaB/YqjD/DUF883 family membrane-anchored ribosome-binding protein